MATITVRVSEKEKEFLDRMAKFENKSLSELLKSSTLEILEDKYDAFIAQAAYEEYEENQESIPLDQVLEEFGLNQNDS